MPPTPARDRPPARTRRVAAAVCGSFLVAVSVATYVRSGQGSAAPVTLFGGWRSEQLGQAPRLPQMGVQAAQTMHSFFQQQKWASLFAPSPHSTGSGLATDVSDAELSTVGSTGGRYPSAMESRDATQELASADEARPRMQRARTQRLTGARYPSAMESRDATHQQESAARPHARRARTQRLSYAPFSPHSTEENPGDFRVHQHYEVVPGKEAAGLTDEDGKRVWKRLQGEYRSRTPSTTTEPAVPVVFDEDGTGGHPSHGDEDEMFPDDYTGGGHGQQGAGSRAATPQELTRSRRGKAEGRKRREGARHGGGGSGRREATRSHESEVGDAARHPAATKRASETAAQPAEAVVAALSAVAAAESVAAAAAKATLTPEQALHAWERNHDVDNRAAYHSGAEYRSSKAFAASAAAKEINALPPKVALMKLSKRLGDMSEAQGKMREHAEQLEEHTKDLKTQIAAWKHADSERQEAAEAKSKHLSQLVSDLEKRGGAGEKHQHPGLAGKGIIGGKAQAAKARAFLAAFE
ncbi:hypothetical protein T484DRAFT_1828669, partial [Baffinella frigidus]